MFLSAAATQVPAIPTAALQRLVLQAPAAVLAGLAGHQWGALALAGLAVGAGLHVGGVEGAVPVALLWGEDSAAVANSVGVAEGAVGTCLEAVLIGGAAGAADIGSGLASDAVTDCDLDIA
jgi:hypothetical protein